MIRALAPTEDGAGRSGYLWEARAVDPAHVDALISALGCSPMVATLLCARGIEDAAAAEQFLRPSLLGLSGPETLPDMDRAIAAVQRSLAAREPICIYGDYDVDGVTASAMLVKLFRHLGVEASCYVPHRLKEGYGLNEDAIRELAGRGVKLLITVDGGSNDHAELALAKELGMEVVVTDHHPIHAGLPDCPVVHPGRSDRPSPFAGLAGVGVAYKLVWGLGKSLAGDRKVDPSYREFMLSALAFVALGTVADVVPLRDENRLLVHYGLRALAKSDGPGLRALIEECGLSADSLKSDDIAFRLAPHINAAGRVGHAEEALELLLTDDPERARELAKGLAQSNRRRREIETKMLESCEEMILEWSDEAKDRPFLLAREGWHAGVAGIVASRLVDRYQRPVAVVAVEEGIARGSLRSIPELPLESVYEAARPKVLSIGGHACAGGLTVEPSGLDGLRSAMNSIELPPARDSRPTLHYDYVLSADDVDLRLIHELEELAPHGQGNPVPRIRLDGLELLGAPRLVGKTEDHLAFSVRRAGPPLRAICFGGAPWARLLAEARRPFSCICEPFESRFQGNCKAEIRVLDLAI